VNRWSWGVLVVATVLGAGCGEMTTSKRADYTTRTRCLDRPSPGERASGDNAAAINTRPMLFLFCVQGP
jgi:hypothetical protein